MFMFLLIWIANTVNFITVYLYYCIYCIYKLYCTVYLNIICLSILCLPYKVKQCNKGNGLKLLQSTSTDGSQLKFLLGSKEIIPKTVSISPSDLEHCHNNQILHPRGNSFIGQHELTAKLGTFFPVGGQKLTTYKHKIHLFFLSILVCIN